MASALKLTGNGAGRLHIYEDIRDDFYKQMTGEIKAPSKQSRNKLVWQQKAGTAREAWDCTVYARHAAMVEKLHIKKPEWWQDREAQLLQKDLLSDQNTEKAGEVVTTIDNNPSAESSNIEDQKNNAQPSVTTNSSSTKTTQPTAPKKPRRTSMADLGRMMG
jgi:phage terminase large subunit GpA-like protein